MKEDYLTFLEIIRLFIRVARREIRGRIKLFNSSRKDESFYRIMSGSVWWWLLEKIIFGR